MSKINKIEDIEIYKISLSLANQIRAASISVSANIAEGYGRRTRKDFAQFLSIALGSVNEIIAY